MAIAEPWKRSAALLVTLPLAAGCLTPDAIPPQGSAVVTATADEALVSGFDTEDGYHVTYQRFLLSLGQTALDGPTCDENNNPYARVLDMRQAGSQRVSLLYALGSCQLSFEMAVPRSDSRSTSDIVLGTGVTQRDLSDLLRADSDAHAQNYGASAIVAGTATKDGRRKRFSFTFRVDVHYSPCLGDPQRTLHFARNTALSVDIVIPGRGLFLAPPGDPSAPAIFAPMAAADDVYGDGNGEVTLDELTRVPTPDPVSAPPIDGGLRDAGADASFRARFPVLSDYLYRELFPNLPTVPGHVYCYTTTGAL